MFYPQYGLESPFRITSFLHELNTIAKVTHLSTVSSLQEVLFCINHEGDEEFNDGDKGKKKKEEEDKEEEEEGKEGEEEERKETGVRSPFTVKL